MKIALSGAQCTGKTTLLNKLKSSGLLDSSYEYVVESIRNLKKQGFAINEDGDNTSQLMINNMHFQNLYRHGNMVFDRCLLDGIVFTHYQYDHGHISKWVYEYTCNLFDSYVRMYDLIIYTMPDVALVPDGTRSMNVEFRDEVIRLFDFYLYIIENDDRHLKALKLIKVGGSVEQRMEMVDKAIREINEK
jgi:nicotinamide riboside kinase